MEQPALDLQPPVPTLHFEPVGHRYTLRIAPGQEIELPSVTDVLKQTRIIDYSGIPRDVLLAASKRGTAVHTALHYLDEETLDPDTLDESIHGYVMAYLAFKRDTGFQPALVEHRDWHRAYRYAGTLDRTGTIVRKDGGEDLAVVDFKTGLVMRGHALQLAAYADMQPKPTRFRRIALQLMGDGKYKVHEFPSPQYPEHTFFADKEAFLHALSTRNWQMNYGKVEDERKRGL